MSSSTHAGRKIWTTGYTRAELDAAQERYGLVFPPDLVDLWRERRLVDGCDWRTDEEAIRERLAWPFEGLLFDVEHDALWWAEWGERPPSAPERAEVLREVVSAAPKLIPLYSHRYLPAEPHEAVNPVFSVYQSDVIYYGVDLADYFLREFDDSVPMSPRSPKRIRFWSDMVERNGTPDAYRPEG